MLRLLGFLYFFISRFARVLLPPSPSSMEICAKYWVIKVWKEIQKLFSNY
jgi:hypothetical protein